MHFLTEHHIFNGVNIWKECREALSLGEWDMLNELLLINEMSPATLHHDRVLVNQLLMELCSMPRFRREVIGGNHLTTKGIELLIGHGGDLKYCNERNVTLLIAALRAGNVDFADFILDKLVADSHDLLSHSVIEHVGMNRRGSKFLLKYLNAIDVDGENAISEAVRQGNEKAIIELLRLGVDVEWKFEGHFVSAIQIACQTMRYLNSSPTIERLLTRTSSSIDVVDDRGNTILHYLAFGTYRHDTVQSMKWILASSLSAKQLLNKRNKEGQTPLHFAVMGGVFANVSFLLSQGAQVSIADVRGYTALHLATDDYGENNYEILFIILSVCKERDLNLPDQWGRTALMHAAGKLPPIKNWDGEDFNGNHSGKALLLLLEKGASVEARDNYGQNVLHHYYGRQAENQFLGRISTGISS